MRVISAAAALVVVAAFSLHVSAQTQQQIDWCNGNDTVSPDLKIGGCTAVIQSGNSHGNDLAAAFNNRGLAHEAVGQHDRAILGRLKDALADCNRALELKPGDADALDTRGFTYLKMKSYDAAIANYNAALKAKPKLAPSLYGRGGAKLAKGNAASGGADIAAARKIDPGVADELARYGIKKP